MKVVLVGTYTPDTNYNRDLSTYFVKVLKPNDKFYLCGYKGELVIDGKEPKVDKIWDRNLNYISQIYTYSLQKKADIVHISHEFKTFGGFFGAILFPLLLLLLKFKGIKTVVTIHGNVASNQVDYDFLKSFNVQPNFFTKIIIKLFFSYIYFSITSLSDYTTVHSPALKKVQEDYNPYVKNKIVVIEHGVRVIEDLNVSKNKYIYKEFPLLKGKKTILVFGLFSPRKGYEYLIRSYNNVITKLKDDGWIMVLCGDVKDEFMQYKKTVEKMVKDLKLDKKVLITGYVNAMELDEFYRSATIQIIPAIISFNTSGALSLALAYKKPLIVANVKPLATEVKENNFGLLYEKSGPNSLEKQLEKLMKSEKMYKSMLKNLEKSVAKRYWTKISKEHYDLYEKALWLN
jgi:glycosyltransferase involved in cell wall biosynthesis